MTAMQHRQKRERISRIVGPSAQNDLPALSGEEVIA
jgi:hypothetical protein